MRTAVLLVAAILPSSLAGQVPTDSAASDYFVVVADELASSSGLGPITASHLAIDDIELRIWGGYGLAGVWGTVARRRDRVWIGEAITERHDTVGGPYRGGVRVPANGNWEAVYRFALDSGLLTLPGLPTRPVGQLYSDGYSVVVQLRRGDDYRVWVYANPDLFKTTQDSIILAIADSAGTIAWPKRQ